MVFIPKYRKRSIYGWVRQELGPIIRDLAQQKESGSGGGAPDGRPCSHAVVDTTEVLGLRGTNRSFPVAGFIFPIANELWQSNGKVEEICCVL